MSIKAIEMCELYKQSKEVVLEYWMHHRNMFAFITVLNVLPLVIVYNGDFIINQLKFIFTLSIAMSGGMLASIFVVNYVYKPMVDKYAIESESESEEEEEELYENKYDIEDIEDLSGNPTETVYISDMTPDGIAFMRYNEYKEGFEYWSERSIKYDYLETICRKFVKIYRCKNMYIDRKRLLKEKREKAEEKRKREEEMEEMEKEDLVKVDNIEDEYEDVFAKLKSNVDKRYENKKIDAKAKADLNVVDKANKFIYMGKLTEMEPFNTKRTDELPKEKEKKEMSFSMFKRMGF